MTCKVGTPNMAGMDTNISANDVIERLGGTYAVAKIFGIAPPSVSEWKRNGIPAARRMYLELKYPDLLHADGTPQPPQREVA